MSHISTFIEAQNALRPFYKNTSANYTLKNMQQLMQFLGNPQDSIKILHVAGTSGKTSTAYYAAELLRQTGKQVGLTVSPHVDQINERLQINGMPLPENEFCATLEEFLALIEDCPVEPSYFECLMALAFWEFERQKLDYAVVEVGLGGLLDGTNVITQSNKVCVITDIGLDHTKILGDTLPEIATQKAGIIHRNNAVFMNAQDAAVVDVITRIARLNDAELTVLDDNSAVRIDGLPPFQQRNLGLSVAAVNYVLQRDFNERISEQQITTAAQATIPARLERIAYDDKTIILDGAHNQQKMQALMYSLQQLEPGQDIAVLCSFVQGSDERWQKVLEVLLPRVKQVIFTTFYSEEDYQRGSISSDDFANACNERGFTNFIIEPDPATAFTVLLGRPEPVLLVTGSFYLMSHIRPLLRNSS